MSGQCTQDTFWIDEMVCVSDEVIAPELMTLYYMLSIVVFDVGQWMNQYNY